MAFPIDKGTEVGEDAICYGAPCPYSGVSSSLLGPLLATGTPGLYLSLQAHSFFSL